MHIVDPVDMQWEKATVALFWALLKYFLLILKWPYFPHFIDIIDEDIIDEA